MAIITNTSYNRYTDSWENTTTTCSTLHDSNASGIPIIASNLKKYLDIEYLNIYTGSTNYLSNYITEKFDFTGTSNYYTDYLYGSSIYPTASSGYYIYPLSENIVNVENTSINKRLKLRSNLSPALKIRSNPVELNLPENEKKAIETLREEITEKELRKYLRYGFVLVQGKSGKTYQIFRNRHHTKVWLGGKLIEEVCVRLSRESKVPPTDNVIAFIKMIETDEEEFRKCGNVYNMVKKAA